DRGRAGVNRQNGTRGRGVAEGEPALTATDLDHARAVKIPDGLQGGHLGALMINHVGLESHGSRASAYRSGRRYAEGEATSRRPRRGGRARPRLTAPTHRALVREKPRRYFAPRGALVSARVLCRPGGAGCGHARAGPPVAAAGLPGWPLLG